MLELPLAACEEHRCVDQDCGTLKAEKDSVMGRVGELGSQLSFLLLLLLLTDICSIFPVRQELHILHL